MAGGKKTREGIVAVHWHNELFNRQTHLSGDHRPIMSPKLPLGTENATGSPGCATRDAA